MKKTFFTAGLMLAVGCVNAWSASGNHSNDNSNHPVRASSHAPLGVMGDHLHGKGEFMMSYRFMHMDMDGSRVGSRRQSARQTVGTSTNPGQFMVAPTSMPMEMHMFGAMYGLTDSITLMAMTSYLSNSMDHLIRNGRTFTTESAGLGDSKISAMGRIFDNGVHRIHWTFGVSVPTGSTDERDDTPAMRDAFLPYPMQLGSGTYDALPAINYSGNGNQWNWGLQASAVIRTGDNDEGYTLGDRFGGTAWLARDFSDNLSLSLRANYQDWDNIDGFNPALNPRMIQTANTQLQGGDRTDLSLGINYLFNSGHRLSAEYGQAISQNLNGPQLETDKVWTIGWQKAF